MMWGARIPVPPSIVADVRSLLLLVLLLVLAQLHPLCMGFIASYCGRREFVITIVNRCIAKEQEKAGVS